jgi:hypothetical protein
MLCSLRLFAVTCQALFHAAVSARFRTDQECVEHSVHQDGPRIPTRIESTPNPWLDLPAQSPFSWNIRDVQAKNSYVAGHPRPSSWCKPAIALIVGSKCVNGLITEATKLPERIVDSSLPTAASRSDGDIGVGIFPEDEEVWDGYLTAWILGGEQRPSHSDRAKQRDSSHPATS